MCCNVFKSLYYNPFIGIDSSFVSILNQSHNGQLMHSVIFLFNTMLMYILSDFWSYLVGCSSSLQRLSWALNSSDGLADLLSSKKELVRLRYLNLRKSKISSAELSKMSTFIKKTERNADLETIVLDGIKLSGCSSLRNSLGKGR